MASSRKKAAPQAQERTQPWVWEHRVGVTPFAISLLVLVWTFLFPGLALTPTPFVVVTLVVGLVFVLISERKWGGSKKVSQRQMLYYSEALIVTCVALAITFKVWGQLTRDWLMWGFVVWVGLTLLFGAFWWNDHANLLRIKKEKEVVHWPKLAEKIGMPTLMKSQVRETETGKRVRFWWEGGTLTKSRVKQNLEGIESVMDLPGGLAKFEDVVDGEGEIDVNQIDMVWNDKAPGRKEAIAFTEPTALSATDLITIAYREDGEPVQMSLYDQEYGGQHMLAGGTTGSGKSGLYHLLMAETADARDIVRWGMDFKGGMAFRPWAPLFDWFIDDEKEALDMMAAVRAIIEARAKFAAAMKWDPWQVDEEHPLLVVCVDECAVLFGQGVYQLVELGKIIAQQGRACGVILCLATQHATNESVGSQQIMKNITRRFCFRCADSTQQSVLLPTGWDKVDATAIPAGKEHAGKAYWSDGGVIDTLMMRVRFVTKQMIKDLVAKYGEFRCDLDEGTQRAARLATQKKDGTNAYDLRHIWTVEDLGPEGGTEGLLPDEVLDDAAIWDQIFGAGNTAPVTAARPVAPQAPAQTTNDMPAGATPPPAPPPPSEDDGLPEEIDMDYDERGNDIPTAQMVEPTTQEEADELDAAIAKWDAERSNRVTTEEAEERLHRALVAAGREGAQFGDLLVIVERKKTWLADRLTDLMLNAQSVHRPGKGVYAYTDMELAKHLVDSVPIADN